MKSAILFFCLFLFHETNSQFPSYCVYLVKGNVTVKRPATKSEKLKQNAAIFNNDTLIVSRDSEIQLIDKDGNFMLLSIPGKYDNVKLRAKGKVETRPGLTNTYLALVYHEILHPGYDVSKLKANKVGAAYGGAVRGSNCHFVFPIDGLKTSGDSLSFIWNKISAVNNYMVNFYDSEDAKILAVPVTDTVVTLDLHQLLKKHGIYSWSISINDEECDVRSYFQYMTPEKERSLIKSEIDAATHKTLIDTLDFISKLENNGFIATSLKYYKRLVTENPNNHALAKSYGLFCSKYAQAMKNDLPESK